MQSRINKVKKELRALKKGAHAIERLIEIQGMHFTRIKALSALEESEEKEGLIRAEKEIIASLKLEDEIAKNAMLAKQYSQAISTLSLTDRAMVLDCYMGGKPYWKIGMEYGFSEEGARKHIDRLVKKIAEVKDEVSNLTR